MVKIIENRNNHHVIGFGAESLVADVVTGVFLVFENQFNVGDIIEVGGFRGTVEQIGIRTTYIRDAGDNIKIINNSDLRNILNRSAAQSWAKTDVAVSYNEDLERVEKVLAELLPKIRAKYPEVFPNDPVYSGVQELADSGVVLRIAAIVREQDIYKDIPIIILSTEGEERDIQKGIQLGANLYMVKPAQPEKMVRNIKMLLG